MRRVEGKEAGAVLIDDHIDVSQIFLLLLLRSKFNVQLRKANARTQKVLEAAVICFELAFSSKHNMLHVRKILFA